MFYCNFERIGMFNCYRVFYGDRLISVVASEYAAENFVQLHATWFNNAVGNYRYEGAFIEGIGF